MKFKKKVLLSLSIVLALYIGYSIYDQIWPIGLGPIKSFIVENREHYQVKANDPTSIKELLSKHFDIEGNGLFAQSMLEADNVFIYEDNKCQCRSIISDLQLRVFHLFWLPIASEHARFIFRIENDDIQLDNVVVSSTFL